MGDKGMDSTTTMLANHVLKAIALSVKSKSVGKVFNFNEQTIEAFFRALLTEEYADMIRLSAVQWSYELQIRFIIAFMRLPHIVLHQLHLNWLGLFFFQRIYHNVIQWLNCEVLEKEEQYHCRFAQYCGFK